MTVLEVAAAFICSSYFSLWRCRHQVPSRPDVWFQTHSETPESRHQKEWNWESVDLSRRSGWSCELVLLFSRQTGLSTLRSDARRSRIFTINVTNPLPVCVPLIHQFQFHSTVWASSSHTFATVREFRIIDGFELLGTCLRFSLPLLISQTIQR